MGFRVYSGDFQYTAALGTSYSPSIGAVVDPDHSFLVFEKAGSGTPNLASEGATTGYISSNTQLCFQRYIAVDALYISWWVITCNDNEFTVRERNEMNMTTSDLSDNQSVTSIVDSGQCTIVSNGCRCNAGTNSDWNTAFCRIWVSSNTAISADRYAAATARAIDVRYEVLEWDSSFNIYNGKLSHTNVHDSQAIGATVDLDRSISFSTWNSASNGIQQVESAYNISANATDFFARHYDVAYTQNHAWYIIEFPLNKAPRIERFSYMWNPTTAPLNVRWNPLVGATMNKDYTFIRHSDNVDGTGTAFMRAFNIPVMVSSTGWTETQRHPTTATYDLHITEATVIELPAGTNYTTPVGGYTSWDWKSGTHGKDSGMRATDTDGLDWDWKTIKCTSNSFYYPSGSYTSWSWKSGNAYE